MGQVKQSVDGGIWKLQGQKKKKDNVLASNVNVINAGEKGSK